MKKTKLLSLALSTSLLLTPLTSLAKDSNQSYKKLDRMMLSMSSRYQTKGPVKKHNEKSRRKYSDELLKIILQRSHDVALPYLKAGDHKAYFAFIVLGLTVPYHEGLYVQFRERSNKDKPCRDDINTGAKLIKKDAKHVFKKYLLGGKKPMVISCKKLKGNRVLKQILAGGSDHSDLGVMQISTAFHLKKFFSKNSIHSVDKTVHYGIKEVLMKNYNRGFDHLYNNWSIKENKKRYECLRTSKGKLSYHSLIRSTWARYNGGSGGDACRFIKKDHKHYPNDVGFKSSLAHILSFDKMNAKMGNSAHDMHLNPSKNVRLAIKEVISNFKNGTRNRKYMKKLGIK